MLLDPGPLRLFTDEEFPREAWTPTLEGLAVDQVRALDDGAATLGSASGELASSGAAPLDASALGDLAAAASDLDRQSAEASASLAGVVAHVGALEGELGGLANETAADLNALLPPEPTLPPGEGEGGKPDAEERARLAWDRDTRRLFREILGREATGDEVTYARTFYPVAEEREAWIRSQPATPAPPAPPPPGGDVGALIAHYRARLADWIRANFHREPEAGELADVDRVVEIYGTINDALFDQLIAQNYAPRL